MANQPLIECVPNFSEGRDPKVIEQITNEIKSVEGVQLLDVDPGAALRLIQRHRRRDGQLDAR